MTTVNDLKNALRQVLTENGVINKIEAETKSAIFKALEGKINSNKSSEQAHREEDFLINELILEYLAFHSYTFSESVFRSEAGHKSETLSRRILSQTLNIRPTVSAKALKSSSGLVEKPVPLLYYLTDHFKSQRNG